MSLSKQTRQRIARVVRAANDVLLDYRQAIVHLEEECGEDEAEECQHMANELEAALEALDWQEEKTDELDVHRVRVRAAEDSPSDGA